MPHFLGLLAPLPFFFILCKVTAVTVIGLVGAVVSAVIVWGRGHSLIWGGILQVRDRAEFIDESGFPCMEEPTTHSWISLMSTVYLDGVFSLPCRQTRLHGLAVCHNLPTRKKKQSDQVSNVHYIYQNARDGWPPNLPQREGGRQYEVVALGALWLWVKALWCLLGAAEVGGHSDRGTAGSGSFTGHVLVVGLETGVPRTGGEGHGEPRGDTLEGAKPEKDINVLKPAIPK